ncbi:MAG: hypothetical protein AAFN93_29300, partial [Bacteroidota bacterium]
MNPVIWIIGVLVLGLVLKKKRTQYLRLALVISITFTNPFLINSIYKTWEPEPQRISETYDLAIVLTGMTIPTIDVPDQLQMGSGSERIVETLRLYHQGKTKKIMISGGSGN